MKKALVHKHDELAKKFLTNLSVAKEFLTIHLPEKVLRKCDLATLTIESGSYIDNELRKKFSDIVYKVDLLGSNSCAYIYTLIEHQSSAERLMPIRVLGYELAIITNHVKTYGEDVSLPIVIPLVFYNGSESPYPYPTNVRDLVLDKKLFDEVGLGEFRLIDLTVATDDEILKHKKVALLEIVLKHIKARDFLQSIDTIIKSLAVAHADDLPKDLFEGMLSYLTQARDEKDLKPLFNKIITEFAEYREDIMTYAEHYTEKGRQEGRQEGRQKGRQEGRQDMVRELLKSGVSEDIIAKAAHLTLAEIKKLK